MVEESCNLILNSDSFGFIYAASVTVIRQDVSRNPEPDPQTSNSGRK